MNSVSIGSQTNVQDNVVIHVARHNAANRAAPTTIGSNVTIGHGATIHAADIEDCALLGMGATVMDGARVQKGAIVAAGALVPPGATVPSGEIWAGSPAKLLRKLVEGGLRVQGLGLGLPVCLPALLGPLYHPLTPTPLTPLRPSSPLGRRGSLHLRGGRGLLAPGRRARCGELQEPGGG